MSFFFLLVSSKSPQQYSYHVEEPTNYLMRHQSILFASYMFFSFDYIIYIIFQIKIFLLEMLDCMTWNL